MDYHIKIATSGNNLHRPTYICLRFIHTGGIGIQNSNVCQQLGTRTCFIGTGDIQQLKSTVIISQSRIRHGHPTETDTHGSQHSGLFFRIHTQTDTFRQYFLVPSQTFFHIPLILIGNSQIDKQHQIRFSLVAVGILQSFKTVVTRTVQIPISIILRQVAICRCNTISIPALHSTPQCLLAFSQLSIFGLSSYSKQRKQTSP